MFVNCRVLAHPLTGVQRYLLELLERMAGRLTPLRPRRMGAGMPGHLWEQTVLAARAAGGVLWSPANTGPILLRRQVVTLHDLAVLDHPEWFAPRYAAWYAFMLPRLIPRVAAVIAPSAFTRDRIVERWPRAGLAERVHVIPHGIGSTFAPRSEAECAEALSRLGLSAGRYMLTLGSLEPRKNLGRVIEAWSRASSGLPEEIELVVAGESGSQRVFRDAGLAAPPRRVRFLGRVDEASLPALYAGALALVFVPLYEGFGMPVLEAMACGTPVICATAEPMAGIAGGAALLAASHRPEEIADAIRALAEDPARRAELRRRGLECARQFRWDTAAEETWRVLSGAAQAAR